MSIAIAPDGRTLYAVDNGKVAAIPIESQAHPPATCRAALPRGGGSADFA